MNGKFQELSYKYVYTNKTYYNSI